MNHGALFRIKLRGRKWSHRPPTPSVVSSTSIPRFPANAISSRQQIRPPSLMSCPALSRRSERAEKARLLPSPFKKNQQLTIVPSTTIETIWIPQFWRQNRTIKKEAILQISMQMNHLKERSVFTFQSQLTYKWTCECTLTLYEWLCGIKTGGQEFWSVHVRRAVTQLTVALSQSRSSQAVIPWTYGNPQQHPCTQGKGLEGKPCVTMENASVCKVSTDMLVVCHNTEQINYKYTHVNILLREFQQPPPTMNSCYDRIVPKLDLILIFLVVCLCTCDTFAIWILQIRCDSGCDVRTNSVGRNNQSPWCSNRIHISWRNIH